MKLLKKKKKSTWGEAPEQSKELLWGEAPEQSKGFLLAPHLQDWIRPNNKPIPDPVPDEGSNLVTVSTNIDRETYLYIKESHIGKDTLVSTWLRQLIRKEIGGK